MKGMLIIGRHTFLARIVLPVFTKTKKAFGLGILGMKLVDCTGATVAQRVFSILLVREPVAANVGQVSIKMQSVPTPAKIVLPAVLMEAMHILYVRRVLSSLTAMWKVWKFARHAPSGNLLLTRLKSVVRTAARAKLALKRALNVFHVKLANLAMKKVKAPVRCVKSVMQEVS